MYARLHVEAVGGVAGDMLLAALIDVGADVDQLRAALSSTKVPGLRLDVSEVSVNGERARYVRSLAPSEGHSHRHLSEILTVIDRAALSPTARTRARSIFEILARAEAHVHGGAQDDVALHEVGALDSILDVIGIAAALDLLGNPTITASPLPSGSGTVMSEHGELVVPVPAVVEIARTHRIPLEPAPLRGETITPTGIAVLAQACGTYGDVPRGAARVGAGAGTRRFDTRPNIVRVHAWTH